MEIIVLAVLVSFGVASVLGVAGFTDDGDKIVRVVIAAGVGLLVVVVLGALAFGMTDTSGDDAPEVESTPEVESRPTVTRAPGGGVPLRATDVDLVATPDERLPPAPATVGDLADGGVVVLGVSGLDPTSRATVHQCPVGAERPSACRAGIPVTMSEHQRAVVVVDLLDRFDVAGLDAVDCTEDDCSIVVFGSSRLEVATVFGRPAPPPVEVRVDPFSVPPGGTVSAAASGLPPGARVSFALCRPGGDGTADCGPLTRAVEADGSGTASAPVGVSAGRCGRGATCAVAVTVDGSVPRAYAFLHVIGRSGATYVGARVAGGLAAAGVLLLVALVVLRRTDWTPVEGDPFAGVSIPADPFADVPEP